MHETGMGSKALLEQQRWVRRLAGEMVADAGLAEDLVQEAWVQFLSRPPRSPVSLRGWLAKVMRNRARQEWRRDRRREELERDQAEDASGEATSDLVARAQSQQALVAAVLDLKQPYRDIVLLRFFEELESPAIAERLGMPASSVRTRLQRGLELLRTKLEKRHGPQARHWLGALLPLLPRPSITVPRPASTGAASSAAVPSMIGWAALGVLGFSAIATIWGLARTPLGLPEPSPVPEPSVARGVAPRVPDGSSSPAERGEPALREEVRAEPLAVLRPPDPEDAGTQVVSGSPPATFVQVRIDGKPASHGVVLLDLDGGWIDLEPGPDSSAVLRSPIGAGGRAAFEGVAPATGSVGIEPHGGAAVLQRNFRRRGEGEPIRLELGTARLEGRVRGASGEPASGVVVLLGMKIGRDYGALSGRCLSDSQGRFVFDRLPAASFWLHAQAPGRVGEMRSHGELAPGEIRELELGHPMGRVRWSGRLVDLAGRAVVFEPRAEHRLEFKRLGSDAERAYFPAELLPDGSYSVELVPGEYAVRRTAGDDSSTQVVESRLSVRGDQQRDLILRGARIHGSVHLVERGTPIDPSVDGPVVLHLLREDENGGTTRYTTVVGAGGRYAFDGVEPGRWILQGERLEEETSVVILLGATDRERVVDTQVR